MKGLFAAALGLLVLVLTVLFVVPAGTAGQARERPFLANIRGHTTGITYAAPGTTDTFGGLCTVASNWRIEFAGTGTVSGLGRVTWASSHCTQVGANPPATVTISDGVLDFVAANGDVLHQHYGNGRLRLVSATLVCIDDDATFDGGTGRFAQATGSAFETTCFDPADPSLPELEDFRTTSVGMISYDASDRAG